MDPGGNPVTARTTVEKLPHDEYCARIGAPNSGSPTSERLEELQRAQVYGIPYENFDIHLGKGINLEPTHLFQKLVRSNRGGYCFELNGLFLRALESAGFRARPLLARVHLGRDPTGRGHQLSLVTIADREWVVDVGFAMGPRAPIPLELDNETHHDGAVLRLSRHALGTMVQRKVDGAWMDLYSFDLTPVVPNDITYGNHFTSTHPSSFNAANRIAVRCRPEGESRLFNFRCTTINMGVEEIDEFPDDDGYLLELQNRFGIELGVNYDKLLPVPAEIG